MHSLCRKDIGGRGKLARMIALMPSPRGQHRDFCRVIEGTQATHKPPVLIVMLDVATSRLST